MPRLIIIIGHLNKRVGQLQDENYESAFCNRGSAFDPEINYPPSLWVDSGSLFLYIHSMKEQTKGDSMKFQYVIHTC